MKIKNIEDTFKDLSNPGPLEIELGKKGDKKTLELDVDITDIHPLMTLGQGGELDEEDLEKLTETLKHIFRKSYLPYYNPETREMQKDLTEEQQEEVDKVNEYIESLILKNYFQIFTAITKELGWQDQNEIEEMMERGQKKGFQRS